MRDEIMRLAERAAEMLDMFEQALVQYAPISDIERWPYHPEITDTAELLRALARTDHAEDKLGMVAEGWQLVPKKSTREMRNAGQAGYDGNFDLVWTYMLAASPAPDHSAGVGGMVASTLHIPRSESLDPIYCYFEDTKPGAGRITIACFGDAWTAAWGAMGDRTVRQFVAECDSYYLTNSLLQLRGANKRMRDYTGRIGASVIAALAQPADAEGGDS
jgi:hypothetical protein